MGEAFDDILEPRKKYYQQLEKAHLENATLYFDNLAKEAKIDAAENKKLCDKVYAYEREIKTLKEKEGRSKALLLVVIIGFFVLLFVGLIMAAVGARSNVGLVVGGFVLVGLDIAAFIFFLVKRTKNVKILRKQIDEKNNQMNKYKNEAYGLMAALNNLYEWNIYNILMAKTIPLIKMDRIFDMEKYNQLKDKFNYQDSDDVHSSTVLAQSGSILGNPFIICRDYRQSMINHTYTGSITITWTERVSNGKGGYSYRSRSQILTASVSKPKPDYQYWTRLIYGSEAAPDLNFTRDPYRHGYSEADLNKFYKKQEKKVDEYIKKHPNFTPLGNDEFEDFFGGLDRDNEVQYRLLFTPLAQRSMLDILKNKDPYGDDFSFYKKKMINTIISSHSQTADYDGFPSNFYHFDLEVARKNFIQKNMDYFKGVFFDLAPLLSIPLYQQYPTNEYIFKKNIGSDYSRHLTEMEANRYDKNYFKPDNCITPLILKSQLVNQEGSVHSTNMCAYGFSGIDRVENVSKMGGDGRMHVIPVHWTEYQQVSKITPFVVQATDLTRRQFNQLTSTEAYSQFLNKNVTNNAILCSRGLFSFINKSNYSNSKELDEVVNKLFNKEKEDLA